MQDVLGSKVDFYNIVDQMLDLDESEKNNSVHTWPVDRESLQNSIFLLKSNETYAMKLDGEIERLRDGIIEKLSEYGEVERM